MDGWKEEMKGDRNSGKKGVGNIRRAEGGGDVANFALLSTFSARPVKRG